MGYAAVPVESASEVEADLSAECAWRDIVGSTERGNKVVERFFVRQVDDRETETPLISVAVVKKVILPNGQVEQVPGRDARRLVVVVFRPGRWYGYQRRAELRCRARRDASNKSCIGERAGGVACAPLQVKPASYS